MTAKSPARRALIVDHDRAAWRDLEALLGEEGFETRALPTASAALDEIERFAPRVVFSELQLPDMEGLRFIERARLRSPLSCFIVLSRDASVESAVEALKRGADDMLLRPQGRDSLKTLLSAALARSCKGESEWIPDEVFSPTLGDHPSMRALTQTLKHVARSRATVLIQGESGTGKELIAAAIHRLSPRRDRPFISVNCAALAETLLESELFGHERGAFTGAMSRREGRFERAHGGTLFLDEVSEIPLSVQVKLLRFLQERQFERVGGNETIRVDVRIVAATNLDLKSLVESRKFREDLFYRLNVVEVCVPPLRERRSDIPLLAELFLWRFREENHRAIDGFTEAAMDLLEAYHWPGNVRELENAIERAVVLCEGGRIDLQHLPKLDVQPTQHAPVFLPGISLAELERRAILQTLDAVGGSTAKAAAILGISRRKIQYRCKEWGITRISTPCPDDDESPLKSAGHHNQR